MNWLKKKASSSFSKKTSSSQNNTQTRKGKQHPSPYKFANYARSQMSRLKKNLPKFSKTMFGSKSVQQKEYVNIDYTDDLEINNDYDKPDKVQDEYKEVNKLSKLSEKTDLSSTQISLEKDLEDDKVKSVEQEESQENESFLKKYVPNLNIKKSFKKWFKYGKTKTNKEKSFTITPKTTSSITPKELSIEIENEPQDIQQPASKSKSTSYFSKFKSSLSKINPITKIKAQANAVSNIYNNTFFFLIAVGSGIFFFILSLYFLPFFALAPGKFNSCFMLGSISCISAMGIMKGWKNLVWYLLEKERRWISLMYIVTLLANIYFAIIRQTYIMALILAILQIFSLSWLVAAAVPGGKRGMRLMTMIIKNVCGRCVKCCFKILSR